MARDAAPAEQQRLDLVVADAERLRADEPAEADREAAERRPPHPVNAAGAANTSSAA